MKKSLLAVALSLGVGAAHAVQLESSGTIQNRCDFGSPSAGVMEINTSDFTQIGTEFVGGQRASVDIAYFGTPTLTVSTPAGFSTSPDLETAGVIEFSHLAFLANADANFEQAPIAASTDVSHQFTTGSSDTLQVGFTADAADLLPVGDYTMVVEATCL